MKQTNKGFACASAMMSFDIEARKAVMMEGLRIMTIGKPDPDRRGGVPRGLSLTAPVLFSYGFRPFFLGASLWAIAAMALWLANLAGLVDLAEGYGAPHWHAHEMIFGYASAVLAGFLLTAVPNWTGRLPVSGWPLVFLFLTWGAGRLSFLFIDEIGNIPTAILDSAFLPILLFICVQEVVAGRKWKDLKVIGGLGALSFANILFHYEVLSGMHPGVPIRLALSAYTAMIVVVGGRIIPSFTRNWLNKTGRTDFPVPYNWFDTLSIITAVATLGIWTLLQSGLLVFIAAMISAVLHGGRLARWRGMATLTETLVFVLHVSYFFVPVGFLAIALSSIGLIDQTASLHVITIGTVAMMMLAVMTRATRGHTGRILTASKMTSMAYIALIGCAVIRPLTAAFPGMTSIVYPVAGGLWLLAFGLFIFEYGPMLAKVRRRI